MNPSDLPSPPLAPPPPTPILDPPPKPILAPPPDTLSSTTTSNPFSLKEFLKGLHAELINVLSAKDQVRPYWQRLKGFFTDFSLQHQLTRKHKLYLLLFGGFVSGLVFLYKITRPPPKRLTFASYKPCDFTDVIFDGNTYDVIVVGGGPSGSSCAFHLAKQGKKVLLLEKKAFPREKYCAAGEAVTHGAQDELAEMGVLQGLLDENLAHSVDIGGFVSPCGNSFVGSSLESLESLSMSTSSAPSSSSDPSAADSRPASPRPPSPSPAPSSSEPPSRPPSPRPHSPLPASPSPTSNSGFRGVLTIKRLELDHRLAKAAQNAGAVLIQNMNVLSAEFDATTGVWSIECKDEQASTPAHPLPNLSHHRGSIGGAIFNDAIPTTPTLSSTPHLSHDNDGGHGGVSSSVVKVVYKGRALVCADGATSRLARSLGVVHSEPTAVCSRSYVQVPHAFKWDGMLFYPPSILPGCCAIVRHVGGELSYMTFINPAMGGQAKEDDLSRLHHEFIKTDPYISQALGPFIYLERMKAASLRIGGVGSGLSLNNFRTVSSSRAPTGKDRSYGDHLLVVGDAAGFVDPFTGLGIQYALEGGKIAAGVLLEGFYKQDLSIQFLEVYERRWAEAFGNNFYWSLKMGQLLCRFPILLDATAKLIQRKGDQFLADWMQAMTGTRSKTWFLSLGVWPFLFVEIILELIRRQIRQR